MEKKSAYGGSVLFSQPVLANKNSAENTAKEINYTYV